MNTVENGVAGAVRSINADVKLFRVKEKFSQKLNTMVSLRVEYLQNNSCRCCFVAMFQHWQTNLSHKSTGYLTLYRSSPITPISCCKGDGVFFFQESPAKPLARSTLKRGWGVLRCFGNAIFLAGIQSDQSS